MCFFQVSVKRPPQVPFYLKSPKSLQTLLPVHASVALYQIYVNDHKINFESHLRFDVSRS